MRHKHFTRGRVCCMSSRFVMRVSTASSGKLSAGSAVTFLAVRDSGVTRPLFRIFNAADLDPAAGLKAGKKHSAYIGKIQALSNDSSSFSVTARKTDSKAAHKTPSNSKSISAGKSATKETKSDNGARAYVEEHLPDPKQTMEYGLIMVSPRVATSAGSKSGADSQQTAARSQSVQVILPPTKRFGKIELVRCKMSSEYVVFSRWQRQPTDPSARMQFHCLQTASFTGVFAKYVGSMQKRIFGTLHLS